MRLYNMIGVKLVKYNEDESIHMLRIIGMRKPYKITEVTKDPSEIMVYDYDTKEKRKVNVSELSEYHPIEPDGIFCASVVNMFTDGKTVNDVIVTVTKYLNIKLKITNVPFAVCRQNITDVFYNLLISDESQMIVGLAVNQNNCPTNFDYSMMFSCNQVIYSDFINFYRNDTLEDIYPMLKMNKYDDVLRESYTRHINFVKKPQLAFKSEDGGWCRDLKTLLKENNFQSDINEMLDIAQVDFNVSDYLEEKELSNGSKYSAAREDFRLWLSLNYKTSIKEAIFVEYDHDINLAEYNNATYLFIRDNTGKLYFVVYTVEGKFFEADLIEKSKEMDFSTKFKMDFYNKYNNCNNMNQSK